MNLLLDLWIPLRRHSGRVETVAPWQVTDGQEDDPFCGFATPRADFDGALAQFLIGLLQTALSPGRSREWRQRFDTPPSPEELRKSLEPLAFAFELFGNGPRFLQDLTLEAEEHGEEPIERLLIEAPGENTVRLGKDHFVKAGRLEALCPSCAAAALLTLQLNAPSGGQGHRTGLRGGGPLTTLIAHPESLWETLWLNVLAPSALGGEADGKDLPEDRFPWLAPTRTSEKSSGRETTLADVHPLQMYWGMPRRLRLQPDPKPALPGARCGLCSGDGRPLVRTFLQRNLGVNYSGSWEHPLSPHYRKPDGAVLPVHGNPSGLSYRNWLALVQNDSETGARPAAVIEAAKADTDRRARAERSSCRLWAFGYDMDNMKARAWLDGQLPLFLIRPELREALELDAARLALSAVDVKGLLVSAVKQAITDRPKDLAGEPGDVGLRLWQETEAPFYDAVRRIRERLEAGEDTEDLRRRWFWRLRDAAGAAFRSVTGVGYFEATDPRRVARAWSFLQRSLHGTKLRSRLGLPPPSKAGAAEAAPPPGSEQP